jgi:hypothetical protein
MSLNETLYMLEHLRLCPKPFPRSSGVSIMTCASARAFRKLLELAYRSNHYSYHSVKRDLFKCQKRPTTPHADWP